MIIAASREPMTSHRGRWENMGDVPTSVTFSMWDFAGQAVYYNTHQVRACIVLYVRVIRFNRAETCLGIRQMILQHRH